MVPNMDVAVNKLPNLRKRILFFSVSLHFFFITAPAPIEPLYEYLTASKIYGVPGTTGGIVERDSGYFITTLRPAAKLVALASGLACTFAPLDCLVVRLGVPRSCCSRSRMRLSTSDLV